MKNYTITVSGETMSDVLEGIDYARKGIENGNVLGFDEREDASYLFEATGEFKEDDDEDT